MELCAEARLRGSEVVPLSPYEFVIKDNYFGNVYVDAGTLKGDSFVIVKQSSLSQAE